ncbi:MAG: Aspartate-semialdehyde dehydrogenase 2 [Myxococcota bacterium]|nr:Aspartate-semialdehyde dehydrogenase 2 [Myxococcota bacterium]
MSKRFVVAVAGATGAVGRRMIETLERREFPVGRLVPLASEKSVGKSVRFRGEDIPVQKLTGDAFKGVDVALFSAGSSVSKEFCPLAWKHGCPSIDNSSAFRMDPDVPLVVPEVNPDKIAQFRKTGVIANPNCSTIQMVVVLQPLHKHGKIRRVVVSTYQSVSGAGQKGIDELSGQIDEIVKGKAPTPRHMPHPIAFNAIPHIDVFKDDGYTGEEHKMMNETRKIMGDEHIKVSATCVRIPVFYGHSESVNVEFEYPVSAEEARDILSAAPGVKLMDDPPSKAYPLATESAGKWEVLVGRIRQDKTVHSGLNLWIVADNLLKGAALNAVQIAEYMVQHKMLG